jgi:hypothetical protein
MRSLQPRPAVGDWRSVREGHIPTAPCPRPAGPETAPRRAAPAWWPPPCSPECCTAPSTPPTRAASAAASCSPPTRPAAPARPRRARAALARRAGHRWRRADSKDQAVLVAVWQLNNVVLWRWKIALAHLKPSRSTPAPQGSWAVAGGVVARQVSPAPPHGSRALFIPPWTCAARCASSRARPAALARRRPRSWQAAAPASSWPCATSARRPPP